MMHRAGRLGRPGSTWVLLALVCVFVCSCGATLRAREARDIEDALRRMPGVEHVSTEVRDNFSATVVLTDEATPEQTTAVLETFRNRTAAASTELRRRTDIEFRQRTSTFKVGGAGLAMAADRVAQWHALSRAFPGDELNWIYRWASYCCYAVGPGDLVSEGAKGAGLISLKLVDANSSEAIADAYRLLMREFPDLKNAEWQVETATPEHGLMRMVHRYPTELDFSVWQRLNEDQTPPHNVLMVSDDALSSHQSPHVTEQLRSADPEAMKLLAEKHLPIVATLSASSVAYLATAAPDDLLSPLGGRIIHAGQEMPPHNLSLYVDIGRCGARSYPPSPTERVLAKKYEIC